MNRQLSAVDDWDGMDWDADAPDVPTQEPTPEQYDAALHRLRNTHRTIIGDSSRLPEVEVEVYNGTVTIRDEYSFVVLSVAMLRQAAEWVEAQQ